MLVDRSCDVRGVYVTDVVEPAATGVESSSTRMDPTRLRLVTVVGYPLVVTLNCVTSGGAEVKRSSLKVNVSVEPSAVFVIPVLTGGAPSAVELFVTEKLLKDLTVARLVFGST